MPHYPRRPDRARGRPRDGAAAARSARRRVRRPPVARRRRAAPPPCHALVLRRRPPLPRERPQAPRPPGGDGQRGQRPAARRRRRPLPRARAAPLGRRIGRDPPPHDGRRARFRRRAQCRGAPQAGSGGAPPLRGIRGRGRRDDARGRGLLVLHGRSVLRVPGRDPGKGAFGAGNAGAPRGRSHGDALAAGRAREGAKADRARAGADRAARLRALFPDGSRDRPLRGDRKNPLPGPWLGGEFRAVLRARNHLRRAGEAQPAVRAVHLGRPQRAPRHRRGFRARAARGGHPAHLRALRASPRRHRRHRDPLPGSQRDPRGRQGDGTFGGHHRRLGQGAPGASSTGRSRRWRRSAASNSPATDASAWPASWPRS